MGSKVAIVTGGSSGIGLGTAKALKKSGCIVYAGSRRGISEEGINALCLDVTDEESVKKAVDFVMEKEGHIDILVNCAGQGISGAVEFTGNKEIEVQFGACFKGMVNMNRALLPIMREQRNGRIVNISSVAAPIPIPFQTFYSAAKSAVNAYTCALANEVRNFGIRVTAVQPGDTHTGFTSARDKNAAGDEIYEGRISRSVSKMEKDETNRASADTVGAYVAKIALKKNVKPLYAVGFINKVFYTIMKILPCRISENRISHKAFGGRKISFSPFDEGSFAPFKHFRSYLHIPQAEHYPPQQREYFSWSKRLNPVREPVWVTRLHTYPDANHFGRRYSEICRYGAREAIFHQGRSQVSLKRDTCKLECDIVVQTERTVRTDGHSDTACPAAMVLRTGKPSRGWPLALDRPV